MTDYDDYYDAAKKDGEVIQGEHGGRIDYFVVQDFAQKHRVSFNETAAMVRAALAKAQRPSSQATNPES